MRLQSMFYQMDYIRKHTGSLHLDSLEKAMKESLSSAVERTTLPSGICSAVTLSLCYASLRHSHWINTPIFRDILIFHLKTEFRIEGSAAALLTDSVLRDMRALTPLIQSHVETVDYEFLKYLFITAATADNEVNLISDMGLGSEIILKMKSTLKLIMTDPELSQSTKQVFMNEIDAQVYEIMLEVSRDIRKYAWSIHVEKLRYMLIAAEGPVSSLIQKFGARWIFEILVAIGARSVSSSSQIGNRLMKTFLASHPQISDEVCSSIVEQLHEAGLIFPIDGNRSEASKFKWELSAEAASLTADAFALTFINGQKRPFLHFYEFNQQYQKAIIETVGAGFQGDVKESLLSPAPLATEVVKSALKYLQRHENSEIFAGVVSSIKSSEKPAFARRSVEKALQDLDLM